MRTATLVLGALQLVDAYETSSMRTALVLAALCSTRAFERIAGYSPASLVTQEAALDGDQERITHYTEKVTPADYAAVYEIYTKGGSSYPTAEMTLPTTTGITVGMTVTGDAKGGGTATGIVAAVSSLSVTVRYSVPSSLGATSSQKYSHANCKVGGMPTADEITGGCFAVNATNIGGTTYMPTAISNTPSSLTLQQLSTSAGAEMRTCSGSGSTCPYWLFSEFYDFYGVGDYANQFLLAALGTASNSWAAGPTGTPSHAQDFTGADRKARFELIQKAVQHQSVWMWAYRQMEHAADSCTSGCVDCNNGAVQEWDRAMAFYTGAAEGQASAISSGSPAYFPHNQADKRGSDFMTCGPEGGEATGTAQVNHKIFRNAAQRLQPWSCPRAMLKETRVGDPGSRAPCYPPPSSWPGPCSWLNALRSTRRVSQV